MAEQYRLQKWLSACGVTSRRKAEMLILAGRVKVNGQVATLGDKVDSKKDQVTLDDKEVRRTTEFQYYALYKPRGFITTMQDEKNRKCITELTKKIPARVYPMGRLDKDSEGLLLLTNDGDLTHAVTHPKSQIYKTYRVTIRPGIKEEDLNRLCTGVMVDGKMTAPTRVTVMSEESGRVVLEMVLHEGRNREIRKMCEVLGLEVARLKRVSEGNVRLGMLRPGDFRELTHEEITGLKTLVKKGEAKDNHDRNFKSRKPRQRR